MSSLIHNLARFLEMNRDQYLWHAISVVFYWYIAIAIHDIFFHPLARCPGPWISKFSQLPNFYHAIKGDRHIWIWQNHQIYGDKVRIQPNEVVFLAPQASRDIYGSKANVRRSKSYEAWKTVKEANTILTIDPAAHARKRRILNQAFTEKSVKHATEFVSVHTERWIDLISQEKDITTDDGWTRTRNMSDWNDWLVFDILGDICFGRSFDIKEPGPNPIRVMPRLVIKHVQMFYPILQSPFMKFFVWAKPKGLDYLLKLVTPQEVKNYYKFIGDSCKSEQDSRLDMFHFLCNARDPVTNEPYTESALRGEAAMLIVAGSDSTSSVLAGFWFYISRNERAYRRLTDEIRTTFTASEEIKSGPKLASCVYLYACIDESLRMVPAGPSELAREVLAGGATINGEHFPPGVVVGCAPWAMGRNELIFGDSTKFRPERYIPSETTGISVEDVSRIKSYYNPFLIGPGNCAGKNIAMAEIAIVIAKTLFRVDLRAVPGEDLGAGHPSMGWGRRDENQYQVEDAYITVHEGPMLQFKKRMV
ncbi:cytochrome P450 [Aaosphaeria arxii CBS 175.79]|uniref:Cytochrome P450 n=1 Tax=Aaosphaeria arxii CBS 175.79 TaxID=1450172 RepID=A0A6A5XWB3_9PLEO|nr:cytochrome P450 [Aaosphaeria arxii CBS 175.79]KAF2017213.1 cytochrome P450 [Aaosphaeria arxii CBS 175.79]